MMDTEWMKQHNHRDPFDAIPVIPENVESRRDDRGLIYLQRTVPPKSGLQNWVSRKLGFHRARYFDLDETGSFFWKQIDGKRNLHFIRSKLAERFEFDLETSRQAVIGFTKMLMSRGVIGLIVTNPPTRNQTKTKDNSIHN